MSAVVGRDSRPPGPKLGGRFVGQIYDNRGGITGRPGESSAGRFRELL